jgi:hypothetical protein
MGQVWPAGFAAVAQVRSWHECDLRAAQINVQSWESNGLNADVAVGRLMTQSGHQPGRNPAAQRAPDRSSPIRYAVTLAWGSGCNWVN